MAVAEVVVDIKHKAVDRVFDYEIPEALIKMIVPGVRVIVPFGARTLAGVVLRVKTASDFEGKLRKISKMMDIVPILNAELLALGIELAKETGATMISCFDAMIPAAMKAKYRKMFVRVWDEELCDLLSDLFGHAEEIAETVVPDALLPVLREAILAHQVEVVYETSEKVKKKMRRYVELIEHAQLKKGARKQAEVVDKLLSSENPVAKDELGVSNEVLKALLKKGIIRFIDVEVYRDPFAFERSLPYQAVALNDAQRAVVETINCAGNGVVLVHGVTGSGKTEVYLEAIGAVIDAGEQALVLIPEITLTTQITKRFKMRFKNAVAVLHSGLSVGEKYDEWRRIQRGEVSIVIGARSAVFAPLTKIGLIIVDEEHETTYKQEEMPRYHAIEVAKRRGKTHGCPVVLGSATPSLEAYARGQKGVYTLTKLPARAVKTAVMPEIRLVDMNKQTLGMSSGIMSLELEAGIKARLMKKEQIILFLNRRGYSNFMQCRQCQEVVSCPNCDVTLTYHKQVNGLKCHYCNFMSRVVDACLKCESREVRFFGTGTQKVEEFLEKRFPAAKVLRMDVDSTSKKGDHQRMIQAFENKESDILIGTQMVAKGLDFPGVTLVGVLDADLMLHFPDFKAGERTFQILTQVAGRAGRHQSKGVVYIETYSPNHYVMQHVKNQDYLAFYKEEMLNRRRFKYAPYFFHAKVLLTSAEPESLMVISEQVNVYLRKELVNECIIIGPTVPGVARVKNRFRIHFILKYKKSPRLIAVMTHMLAHINHKDVSIAVDYFPVYLA